MHSLPLSAKARLEIYLPDEEQSIYRDLRDAIVSEFTLVFGGCTVVTGKGSYQSDAGHAIVENVLVIYTDTHLDFEDNFDLLEEYADKLREDVYKALDEEQIMVSVASVFHSV